MAFCSGVQPDNAQTHDVISLETNETWSSHAFVRIYG